jgi:hypothetical protein
MLRNSWCKSGTAVGFAPDFCPLISQPPPLKNRPRYRSSITSSISHSIRSIHHSNHRQRGFCFNMTELNIPLLSKLLLLQSRTVDFADNKKAQFQYAMVRLAHTHYSIRLIRLMLRLGPWSTAVIILGRFYQGILPSINLRIKGEFLEIVPPPPPPPSAHIFPPFVADLGASGTCETAFQSQETVSAGDATGGDVLCIVDTVRIYVLLLSCKICLTVSADANAYIGQAMTHKLQIDLLRAHLRLSIADLQSHELGTRYRRVRPLLVNSKS